jgi:Protein of unknown function (DUF2752)
MAVDTTITNEPVSKDNASLKARSSRRLALFGFIGLFVVFLTSVLLRLPATDYFTVCGFKNLTGLPCPGCGLTHSFCALAKGDLNGAATFNLLGPPLYLALLILWVRSACVLLSLDRPVQVVDKIANRLNIVKLFVIGFAVYGVIRIGYLVAYDPASFRSSPLSHLIGSLIQ